MKVVQLKAQNATAVKGWDRYLGWELWPKSNTWLVVANSHDGIQSNATFLISVDERNKIVKDCKHEDFGAVVVDVSYKCRSRHGVVYYACGWWGQTWNKFGLTDAYWLMKTLDPKIEYIRGEELQRIPGHFFRNGRDVAPFIESHADDRFDYYFQSEVEACLKPCYGCGGPLFRVHNNDHPVSFYNSALYRCKDRFILTDKQMEKITCRFPMWMRHEMHACCEWCESILRKRAGAITYERVSKWAQELHEQERLKKLRSLSRQTRSVLKSGNQGALKSLKEEYEQEATSRI